MKNSGAIVVHLGLDAVEEIAVDEHRRRRVVDQVFDHVLDVGLALA